MILTSIPSDDTIAPTLVTNTCSINIVTPCGLPKKKIQKRVHFGDDPVSDIFLVNRIDKNLVLSMFYQPEDFARWRYERNLEMDEERRNNKRPPRCSMDLTKSNMSAQPAPHGCDPDNTMSRVQRPVRNVSISPIRNVSPMRGPNGRNLSPMRGPNGRQLSPLRPCSRGRPTFRQNGVKGKKPMALAA